MGYWRWGWSGLWAVGALVVLGCADNPPKLHYFGDAPLNYYKDVATDIEYPAVESHTQAEVMAAQPPRVVNDRREDEIRDLTLAEAINLALQNSTIIRGNAQLATPGNSILASPNNLPSIYDPAIQESGVLFGGRGVESALSAFDPRWTTSMIWGRDERVQNNPFFSGGLMPGNTLVQETGNFSTRLQKLFADGGSFAVTHDWNYLGVNNPGQLFPTSYTGSLGAEYRLPLLAGAGTEYTRIAGPIATSFGGITGVNQGVVITRINNDITLADFELSVRNLIRDVEDAYWDLYLQYRLYDTAVTTRNNTLELWRYYRNRLEFGADLVTGQSTFVAEPQAREQYYETRAAAVTALGNIYRSEVQLRRLMGLPSNDGVVLRPSDEPPLAEFVPDWELSLVEALTNRVELRRQKFNIKSLELQLQAAQSLVRPRFDFVSGYRVNGFGDTLLSQSDNDGRTAQGLNSAYETLTQGDQTGWNLGFEMTMDIGFRSANAQVRNIELRLAKARDTLAAQELDVSHEVAVTFQDLATNYTAAQANFNRLRASENRVNVLRSRFEGGEPDYDEMLRSELSRALSEAAFYTNLANYASSIAAFHFAKGDLLEFNNVHLTESMWTPEAYNQALRRAIARSHALPNPFQHSEPEEFVSPGYDRVITVEPRDISVPELQALPYELPRGEKPDGHQPGRETPPARLTPVPNSPRAPAYEPPGPEPATSPNPKPALAPPSESAPALIPPMPGGDKSAVNSLSGQPGQIPQSRNLARILARNAESESTPSRSVELNGTTVGTLKPASRDSTSVEQTGFFRESSPQDRNEPLTLDPKRDLLQ
jgi:outer membrane protein TolC